MGFRSLGCGGVGSRSSGVTVAVEGARREARRTKALRREADGIFLKTRKPPPPQKKKRKKKKIIILLLLLYHNKTKQQ